MIIPVFAILFLGLMIGLGFLVYKLSFPGLVRETVNPSHFLLPSLEVTIPADDGVDIPGWWIPGLKGAPGIILAPGYGMSRSDALSLAAMLHDNGFNLLIYSQRGSGIKPASTLGLYETKDMIQAVRFVQGRPESNGSRLGIWGVDVGAIAALRAAADCKQVRAIVVDGAYESVSDFLDYRISEDFGLDNAFVNWGCLQIFRLAHVFSGSFSEQKIPLQSISDRMILFINGENQRGLAKLTAEIYDRIQPQKEMISFKTARVHLMTGEDQKNYDRQVANFFHLNLQ